MPAYKYSHDYAIDEQVKITPKKKTFKTVTNPVKKAKDVKNISKKNKIVALNTGLLICGTVLSLAFVAVYSAVALSETRLTELHSAISNLNYENTDLENKLENVKSYNAVDTKVTSSASFDKAKNVIEVNKVDAVTVKHNNNTKTSLNTVTGF